MKLLKPIIFQYLNLFIYLNDYLKISAIAPGFIAPIRNINVVLGFDAIFECQHTGVPEPVVTW